MKKTAIKRLDLEGLELLAKIQQKANSIDTIITNWNYNLPGTYQVVANYIKELQESVSILENFAKTLSNTLYK